VTQDALKDQTQALLSAPVFGVPQDRKEHSLLPALLALTRHHVASCAAYARIVAAAWPGFSEASTLADLPFLPVQLFKEMELRSVPESEVVTVLVSSGTTGQVPSRVLLDAATADLQAAALVSIMSTVLGERRLPMLIVDTEEVFKDRTAFSARGAGILGMMRLGHRPVFALDGDMNLRLGAVRDFLDKHGGSPFLMFGFTFMVWEYLAHADIGAPLDLSKGVLIHSGGWKRLQQQSVGDAEFKQRLLEWGGITQVYNFYGMVEQVGGVFLQASDGLLYPPSFSDVIIRHPDTLEPLPPGEVGIIQVMSPLPLSYPGHSLLTEDLGVVHHIDQPQASGRLGKAFSVIGRLPRAEIRGCSDTHRLGTT
jgi:hypothetical protein